MKTEIRTQIQEVLVYIADDGTEFNTEAECWEYEVQNKRKTQIEKAEKWYAPQKLDTFGGAYFYGKERTKI